MSCHQRGSAVPRTHKFRIAAAALAAVLALGGCVKSNASTPGTAPAESVRLLGELTVARAGSMSGYSRARFPHWRDIGPNCNVRDAVLQRDGRDLKLEGCNVVDGRWFSEYDGRTVGNPRDMDVDHVVPLAEAWRSGAASWDDERRSDFANDLERPALIAVSRAANRAKGDQTPAQWKPPNRDHWCRYAQNWIAVKHHWRLSVTTAEKAALADMLEGCAWQGTTSPPTSSPGRAG